MVRALDGRTDGNVKTDGHEKKVTLQDPSLTLARHLKIHFNSKTVTHLLNAPFIACTVYDACGMHCILRIRSLHALLSKDTELNALQGRFMKGG